MWLEFYSSTAALESNGTGESCRIDQVNLSVIQEPTSLSLLALGSMALIRRRTA